MPSFINPFHFVPTGEPESPKKVSDVTRTLAPDPRSDDVSDPKVPELLHDRYVSKSGTTECFHGRIVCKLTTISPCVFGCEHRPVDNLQYQGETLKYTIVDNFDLDGHAAISATTLKGMIGTLAEIASGSAMRVLGNRVFSGIWREGVRWMWKDASTHNGDDLLDCIDRRPMHAGRKNVTLAEKMFGWVAPDTASDNTNNDKPGDSWVQAYKGRVRFSDAISPETLAQVEMTNASWPETVQDEYQTYFPLKILSSPKPPCPEFYLKFTDGTDPTTIRAQLLQKQSIEIQGWKFYVLNSHMIGADGIPGWKTGDPVANSTRAAQKALVRPVRRDTEFWFHIDFENLTEIELQLLCYALRPGDKFLHRCGFAKPLGLGAVKVEPVAIAYIDRTARYRTVNALLGGAKRYRELLLSRDLPCKVPQRNYDHLSKQADDVIESDAAEHAPGKSFEKLAHGFAEKIGARHHLITLMGKCPPMPGGCVGVRYPARQGQDPEEELFRWFVANRDDRSQEVQQVLEPLSTTGPIRPLNTN